MLLDSNIIIYAAQPSHQTLRDLIALEVPAVSIVSYVEVLGYHRLTAIERQFYREFFSIAPRLPISEPIVEKAVELRQRQKMTLGDSLIAATALIHSLILATHNTKDFEWIPELSLYDPLMLI